MDRDYVILYRVGDGAVCSIAAILGCQDGDQALEVFFAEHDAKRCHIQGVWHCDGIVSHPGAGNALIENTYSASDYIDMEARGEEAERYDAARVRADSMECQ